MAKDKFTPVEKDGEIWYMDPVKAGKLMSGVRETAEKYAGEAEILVRRFIPKGNSMKYVSQYYLDTISFEINSMPRKMFDYKCAYDIELKYEKMVRLKF